MTTLDLEGLLDILRRSAGDSEALTGADVLDVPFEELGYDSLALLETAGAIERDLGISLADDEVADAATPRLFLELVERSS
ncbi:acyl carrier protein [Actinomadura gamaensis]|uniref:Acyl carrier protein n=1 Tax=Actinomadura gamaensis TaxID=1763541 RepID=A0ABV9TYK6_9ACTN